VFADATPTCVPHRRSGCTSGMGALSASIVNVPP